MGEMRTVERLSAGERVSLGLEIKRLVVMGGGV